MKIGLAPIGFIETDVQTVARHWTNSDAEGLPVVGEQY